MKRVWLYLFLIIGLVSCKTIDDNLENDSSTDSNKTTEESKNEPLDYTKAVWWWNKDLETKYLDFAIENKINEIYYCDSAFDESTKEFLKKANENHIDVYFLTGDYSWLTDSTGLYNFINQYQQFQENSEYKYKGIHLDIEPHQDPNFSNNRIELIKNLITLVMTLDYQYNIEFQYDIPFWLEDNIIIDNVKKKAYEWIIDYADKVVIMSYRDTKEAILSVALEEYSYAASQNKEIMLSVETYSTEGDFVSFYEEGKTFLNNEINSIFDDKPMGIEGIAIHHIKTWCDLKES